MKKNTHTELNTKSHLEKRFPVGSHIQRGSHPFLRMKPQSCHGFPGSWSSSGVQERWALLGQLPRATFNPRSVPQTCDPFHFTANCPLFCSLAGRYSGNEKWTLILTEVTPTEAVYTGKRTVNFKAREIWLGRLSLPPLAIMLLGKKLHLPHLWCGNSP